GVGRLVRGVVLLARRVAVLRRPGGRVLGAARLLIAGPGEREVVFEDAARVGDVAVEVRRRRIRRDRAQVRRPVGRGQQLGDGAEADADHAHAAVGPRLLGGPLDGVVAVLAHGLGERVEDALRATGAADRDAEDRVAAGEEPVAVRRDTVVLGVGAGGVALV